MKILGTEFEHTKFDGLDGKTVSQWKEKIEGKPVTSQTPKEPFTLRVTTAGLRISGTLSTTVSSEAEFGELASLIGEVLKEVRRMRPKLFGTSLAGH